jgi:beta-mannosidase
MKSSRILSTRRSSWHVSLKKIRHLDLPKPLVEVTVQDDYIYVSSPLPVKGIVLEVEDDHIAFNDNCIDVIPGDDQVVHAKGLKGRSVGFMHLGMAAD